MQQIDQPGHFILAVLIFQLIPGPGTLSILRATAHHGAKAGFASVAGTLLGGLLCMLAAASGLEAVFRGQPQATEWLRWAGSVYLAWMGWRMVGQRPANGAATVEAAFSFHRHVRQSLAVSLTNPKVILFYFALLPLFFRPPFTAASLITMVCCVTGISLAWQSGLVIAGNAVARQLAGRPGVRSVMRRLAGLVFIGFAARLVFA